MASKYWLKRSFYILLSFFLYDISLANKSNLSHNHENVLRTMKINKAFLLVDHNTVDLTPTDKSLLMRSLNL